jgi:membrane protein DedA with SNARE-associated domain
MFALSILAAALPSTLCFAASAYMAFHDKAQWKYFAAFAFLAGYGGIYLLYTIGAWRLAVHG